MKCQSGFAFESYSYLNRYDPYVPFGKNYSNLTRLELRNTAVKTV